MYFVSIIHVLALAKKSTRDGIIINFISGMFVHENCGRREFPIKALKK